jgi:plastocyanin
MGTKPIARRRASVASVATVGMGLALAVVVVGCGGLGETAAGDVADGPAAGDAVGVIMQDDVFEPTAIEVQAGAPVTVELENEGDRNHNFTIEGLELSTGPMEPGDVMTATFTPPEGATQFVCTWHPGMVGQITAA